MHEINVKVIKYPDRRFLVMRYTDPLTGQHKSRSAKTNIRREAERAAAAWEAELHAGIVTHGKITWEAFRVRYENEVLASLAKTTFDKATGVLNSVEAIMKPMRLRDLTAERLSLYQAQLRTNGLAETTIAGMLAHLRAALQWAVNVGMLPVIPKIEKPKRAKSGKGMKGRPISGEEFDRMLDKTASVVGEAAADSWRHYLNGLWLSGLRLTESLELWWDRDDKLSIDLSGKFPMMRIPAALEKGNRDRVLPITPDFAEFLLKTPEDQRTGPVFNPKPKHSNRPRPSAWWASRVMAEIGEKAGVKVNTSTKGEIKYASAHDLRRSFGTRWAPRLMPQLLKELMRHSTIETTMKYYVGSLAQTTAETLWQAHAASQGNTFGNSHPNFTPAQKANDSQTV